MPEKFLAIADYCCVKNLNTLNLKKGESYTKKELIDFFGREGVLNYKLKCTKLKYHLVEFDEEKQKSILEENTSESLKEGDEIFVKIDDEENTSVLDQTQAEVLNSELTLSSEIMFLVNKTIKKDNKTIFKKGSKIKISDLKDFDINELVEKEFLSEIKITEQTEIKD
jgi:hypothetical protein